MSAKKTGTGPRRSSGPYVWALVFAGIAVGLYLFVVGPANETLARANKERGEIEEQLRRDGMDLKGAEQVQKRLDELTTLLAPYREALLTPVLESYAMAAKSVLEPLAKDANLDGLAYAEEPVRALPLSKPQPKQLYARKPIRVTCTGTYMDIVSFLLRVEKELPLVALQSWSIAGAGANPDRQAAVLVFEWPVKGVLSK